MYFGLCPCFSRELLAHTFRPMRSMGQRGPRAVWDRFLWVCLDSRIQANLVRQSQCYACLLQNNEVIARVTIYKLCLVSNTGNFTINTCTSVCVGKKTWLCIATCCCWMIKLSSDELVEGILISIDPEEKVDDSQTFGAQQTQCEELLKISLLKKLPRCWPELPTHYLSLEF